MSTDTAPPLLTWTEIRTRCWTDPSALHDLGNHFHFEIRTCRGGRFVLSGDHRLIADPTIEETLDDAQARAEKIERRMRGGKA